MDQRIDVLDLSTKTKNNLKYYGYNNIRDLYETKDWKIGYSNLIQRFSNDLRYKIILEMERFFKENNIGYCRNNFFMMSEDNSMGKEE
jgi:hypothetical protein